MEPNMDKAPADNLQSCIHSSDTSALQNATAARRKPAPQSLRTEMTVMQTSLLYLSMPQ